MELLSAYGWDQIAVVLIVGFGAAFVRGLTGFGMGLILTPILALVLTPIEAVLATNFIALALGLSEMRWIVRNAERTGWAIGFIVVLTTFPGMLLLAATPPGMARVIIALIALSAFFVMLLPERPHRRPGAIVTGGVGVTAGLMTGFAAMPGPPVIPYYVGRAIPREMAKASMILVFTCAAISGVGSGLALGLLEWRLVALASLLFPAILLGNWTGAKASGRISDKAWRSAVMIVLGTTACAALYKMLG